MSNKDKESESPPAGAEPRGYKLFGVWWIVGSDTWDQSYLDLVAPARLRIGDDGYGDIAFGAMEAGLKIEYGNEVIFFRFYGSDEGDEVDGSGSAELQEDGTLDLEFAFDDGDEATLTARREERSTDA